MIQERLIPWQSLCVLGACGGLLLSLTGCPGPAVDDDDDPSPADIELVCDRDYYPAVKELVEGAEESIVAAQWEYFASPSTNRLIAILSEASERGVDVRVLLDEAMEENHTAVSRFQTYGVEAALDNSTNRKVHAKMLVVDGQRAIVGSTNWSWAALDDNRECNIVLRAGQGPAYLGSWFEQLWSDSSVRDAPSLSQDDGLPGRVFVNDDLLPLLLAKIDAAESSIDFTLYATYLQPDNLGAPSMQVFGALASAANRGLAVRGVADFTDWNPANNDSNQEAVSWLRERGIEMRWDDPESNMHAKIFRIDQGLQVQTANVSTSGFSTNHEAGVWTEDSTVISNAQDWFDGLWEESTHIRP